MAHHFDVKKIAKVIVAKQGRGEKFSVDELARACGCAEHEVKEFKQFYERSLGKINVAIKNQPHLPRIEW